MSRAGTRNKHTHCSLPSFCMWHSLFPRLSGFWDSCHAWEFGSPHSKFTVSRLHLPTSSLSQGQGPGRLRGQALCQSQTGFECREKANAGSPRTRSYTCHFPGRSTIYTACSSLPSFLISSTRQRRLVGCVCIVKRDTGARKEGGGGRGPTGEK